MKRNRILVPSALALLSLGAGACSEDTKDTAETLIENAATDVQSAITDVQEAGANVLDSAAETAIRNLATQQGEEQFANADNPLDADGLTCEAKVAEDVEKVDVSCTGKTEDGKAAELAGQTDEIPGASVTELEGSFSGTVDGAEVFTTEKLGG